jgi:hypothetical protein
MEQTSDHDRRRRVMVCLSRGDDARLRDIAKKKRLTLSSLLRMIIGRALDKERANG